MSLRGVKRRVDFSDLKTAEERLADFERRYACFFFEPYDWQRRALSEVRVKTTTAIISSNKIGKTCLVINILLSWVLGYEPWVRVSADHPDAYEVKSKDGPVYYRRSTLGIDPPVSIVLVGEDWKVHIGQTLVPELKKWAPDGQYVTKKNEQGVDYYWEWPETGSTITIMCYTQADDLFESFRCQGCIFDEPPPRTKFTAMSRGLLLDNGKTLLSLTPLKEAWILDELVLSGRRDVGIVDGLKITDNPELFLSDLTVLRSLGLNDYQASEFFKRLLYDDYEKKTPVRDRGKSAEDYLFTLTDDSAGASRLKVLKFIKDIDPDDVPPRVFGQFKSLVGRVLKEFDDNLHVIERFEVPAHWPVTVMIDFHLSTPQAISYWAVNPNGLKYLIGETWENLSADGVADDIFRKVRMFGWFVCEAYIDPLSKGDTAYMKNALGSNLRDTYSILEGRLLEKGIALQVASKDKVSGIKNIKEWLVGPNGLPTCYLFGDCAQHLYEVKRWVYGEDGKPAKEYDHFMENWYRYTLTSPEYKSFTVKPLSSLHSGHGSYGGNAGASLGWMGM